VTGAELKVLLELRPAFDGHSGIPQETRLLFNGLVAMPDIEAIGLIQSSNLVVEPGLPVDSRGQTRALPDGVKVDRLSKVVVSLQQGPASHRFEWLRRKFLRVVVPLAIGIASLFGFKVRLGAFEPLRFKDFVWRSMFSKSLPHSDFDAVTSAAFRVLRWPWSSLHAVGVATSWIGRALYPRLATSGVDIVIAETPFPSRVGGRTRLVVRYHDAIPMLMPHTIKDRGYHRSAHYEALRRNVRDGAWFACVSESTRRDLIAVMPEVSARAVTIPNMVSHHFYNEDSPATRVTEIVWSRKNRAAPHEGGQSVATENLSEGRLAYLLIVGTIEPRKNHLSLLDAWERMRSEGFAHLDLVVVGSLGWDHQAIVDRLLPWLRRGGLHLLTGVPADDLRVLYRHAAATVCPSFGEGFDFPGIEAMRSGGVVAASDLPVHRDVFGEACEYFSAYSTTDLERCLRHLMASDSQERRGWLVREGARVSAQYLPSQILPKWQTFLGEVMLDTSESMSAAAIASPPGSEA
jgi:glycosyltransferase involved in cell wall biosynthesis